jgi:transcription initiation factor TFIID TATA-box-binding protein
MARKKASDKGGDLDPMPSIPMDEILKRVEEKGLLALLPKLANLVATADIDCKFDLHHVAKHARNVEYNPKKFSAAILRIRSPVRAVVLLFSTGKMVITGAKTEADSRLAVKKMMHMLRKIGYAPNLQSYKVQNLVANTALPHMIRLEGFCLKHSRYATLEPELFAGLVYEFLKPKLKMIAFANGKLLFVGAKFIEDIYCAFEQVYPALMEFKLDNPSPIAPASARRVKKRASNGRRSRRRQNSAS